jgi:hypothetical protein
MTEKSAEDTKKDVPAAKKPPDGTPQPGVRGEVNITAGTQLHTPQEMPKRFYADGLYTDPTPQAKAGGSVEATTALGKGTVSAGANASVVGGAPAWGGTTETLAGAVHVEGYNSVPVLERLRLYGVAETGHYSGKLGVDQMLGGPRKETTLGGGVELETQKLHLGGDVTLQAGGGLRLDYTDSKFFPGAWQGLANYNGNLLDLKKGVALGHLELKLDTGALDFSVGVAENLEMSTGHQRTFKGFSYTTDTSPEEKAAIEAEAYRVPQYSGWGTTSLSGTQFSAGVGADIGTKTRVDSTFMVMGSDGEPKPPDGGLVFRLGPGYRHPNALETRFVLDASHQVSDTVTANGSVLLSSNVQTATLGATYRKKSEDGTGFFVGGEAGVVNYDMPAKKPDFEGDHPKGTSPVARVGMGFKFK